MNKNIQHLYSIAEKGERIILGLMSGTSLDGLDIALCKFSGSGLDTKAKVFQFESIPYTIEFKEEVRSIFSKKQVNLEKLCLLNEWIGIQHGRMINDLLQKWDIKNSDIDIIASHGQTIYHAPKSFHQQKKFSNGTLQIGDGDHIAVTTGIITLSDFRQKHIATGGEGAPLAVYGDYLLFTSSTENRVMLNLGGIANFTFLPSTESPADIISTDIGAGNTLMDAYIRQHYPDKHFDKNGEIAREGNINYELLGALKENDFFLQPFPKSTGPELFCLEYVEAAKNRANIQFVSHEDCLATLNSFTAEMIVDAFNKTLPINKRYVVYTSGGGVHNLLLMEHLKRALPKVVFRDFNELGIYPDAKEAVLFAVLANETLCGNTNRSNVQINNIPQISMGKISFPC